MSNVIIKAKSTDVIDDVVTDDEDVNVFVLAEDEKVTKFDVNFDADEVNRILGAEESSDDEDDTSSEEE